MSTPLTQWADQLLSHQRPLAPTQRASDGSVPRRCLAQGARSPVDQAFGLAIRDPGFCRRGRGSRRSTAHQPTVTRSKAGAEVCPVTAKISHQTGYPRHGWGIRQTVQRLLFTFWKQRDVDAWWRVEQHARARRESPHHPPSRSALLGNHATGGLAREAWSTR